MLDFLEGLQSSNYRIPLEQQTKPTSVDGRQQKPNRRIVQGQSLVAGRFSVNKFELSWVWRRQVGNNGTREQVVDVWCIRAKGDAMRWFWVMNDESAARDWSNAQANRPPTFSHWAPTEVLVLWSNAEFFFSMEGRFVCLSFGNAFARGFGKNAVF